MTMHLTYWIKTYYTYTMSWELYWGGNTSITCSKLKFLEIPHKMHLLREVWSVCTMKGYAKHHGRPLVQHHNFHSYLLYAQLFCSRRDYLGDRFLEPMQLHGEHVLQRERLWVHVKLLTCFVHQFLPMSGIKNHGVTLTYVWKWKNCIHPLIQRARLSSGHILTQCMF